MPLNSAQQLEVRNRLMEQFGEEPLKRMDAFFEELNGMRIAAKDSYKFLDLVKAKYPNENVDLVIAAILYGMWQGEIGYEYHLKQTEMTVGSRVEIQ